MTLIIVTVELWRLPSHFPFYWYNFPVTFACYAALICLSASIIYSIIYVHFLPDGPYQDWVIAASAFSCVTSVLCAIDVACTWVAYGFKEIPCCVLTVPGLLKVLETFVAYVVFACIINTSLYLHQPALEWCVAVYSICFIPAALAILLNLGKWQCRLPSLYPIFQLVLSLLSVLLYVSARSSGCSTSSMSSLADSPTGPVIWAASMGSTMTCASGTSDWLWHSRQPSTCWFTRLTWCTGLARFL